MKILITGGLGFIGSNFILEILEKFPDYKITNLDAELNGSNHFNLKEINKNSNYEFVKGNITNKKLIDKLISKNDVIFNFAAESHVDRSIVSPSNFIDSNILGVFTILESIKKYKKKFFQISTDEVYGSIKKGSFYENSPFNPSSPYSSSKASGELLINSYVKTFDIDAIITRCTNNFGPRQNFEKLIPKTIISSLKNIKIPIYGNGKAIRDWIYVKDHCNALLKIFSHDKWGEIYNISSDNEMTNLKIIKKILRKLNTSNEILYYTKDRPGHDYRYSIDSSKIKKELKWKTTFSFNNALEETIDWYVDNPQIFEKDLSKSINLNNWSIR